MLGTARGSYGRMQTNHVLLPYSNVLIRMRRYNRVPGTNLKHSDELPAEQSADRTIMLRTAMKTMKANLDYRWNR